MTDAKTIIREAGGIVHSDGNIFFTNEAQLHKAIDALIAAGLHLFPPSTACVVGPQQIIEVPYGR